MTKSDLIKIILFIFLFISVYTCGQRSIKPPIESVKTDTIERIDTVRDTIPLLVREKVIRTKIDSIPVILNETDTIIVPIEQDITQREYSDDSTYVAFVSGIDPILDSVKVFQRTITINNEITKVVKENKRFGVGLQVGGGYDPLRKQITPYIGFGVQYNLFKF